MLRYLRINIFSILGTAALLALLSAPAQAQNVTMGVFVVDPLITKSDDGKFGGSVIEVIEHIAQEEGWTLNYVQCAFPDCLDRLARGKIDLMGSITYTSKRAESFDYTQETFFMDWGQIYTYPGSPIKSLIDLQGKKVAMLKNTAQYGQFMKLLKSFDIEIEPVFVKNYLDVFELVQNKQADALMVNRIFGDKNIRDYKIKKTPIIFTPMDIRYASKKGSNKALLAAIDRNLKTMIADQHSMYYSAIERMYGNPASGPFKLPHWLLWALGIGFGIAAALSGLNIILRRQVRVRTVELREEITERKAAQLNLRESREMFRTMVEFADAVHWELDLNSMAFTYMSPQIEKLLGYPAQEWTNLEFWTGILHPEDKNEALQYCTAQAEQGSDHAFEYRTTHADGKIVWIRDVVSVISDDLGPKKLVGLFFDITDDKNKEEKLRNSIKEKNVLLREVHHRVKNNMAIISSLSKLQSTYIKNEEARQILLEGRNRIHSMALVHNMLYQSEDFSRIETNKYLQELIQGLRSSYNQQAAPITWDIHADEFSLNIDTLIPCGMIINELATNSIKYAFDDTQSDKQIHVLMNRNEEKIITLRVSDNGVGIPEGMDITNSTSLGLMIVNSLVTQLEGTLELDRSNGTIFTITFDESMQKDFTDNA